MTKSNKILLKSLLKFEFELGKTQSYLEKNNLFFSIQFNFKHIYDLFEVLVLAFNIPDTNYDSLYDILNQLYSNKISADDAINAIELLIQ